MYFQIYYLTDNCVHSSFFQSDHIHRFWCLMAFLLVAQWIPILLAPWVILAIYVRRNDKILTTIPTSALYFGPKRTTIADVHATAEKLANSPPLASKEDIPPSTGRRYIVVGGVSHIKSASTFAGNHCQLTSCSMVHRLGFLEGGL